jgi:general nucleoside transport system ATP-binding protein
MQQRVEILKALYRQAEILILDEPTGVLTPAEADHLFRILKGLKAQGKTIILITHKLREIMEITDTVSVMRRGEMTATVRTADTSPESWPSSWSAARSSCGSTRSPPRPAARCSRSRTSASPTTRGSSGSRASPFRAGGRDPGAGGRRRQRPVRASRVLGGYAHGTGAVRINGAPIDITGRRSDGRTRRARGIAHVPEDRQREGLIMDFAAWENIVFGYHNDPACQKNALLMDNARHPDRHRRQDGALRRAPAEPDAGGQELLGREPAEARARARDRADPDLLLVGQPTRGVDIGAIEFIHQRIIALRDAGKAILLVSVELDEIMSLSDRIAVMFDGRIMGERDPAATDQRELGLLMAGMAGNDAPARAVEPEPGDLDAEDAAWVDVFVIPLISLDHRLHDLGARHPRHRREPDRRGARDDHGRARVDLRLGLHALLRDELHVHRPRLRGGLPRGPLQHRRRGAGDAGRARRGARLPDALPWPHWSLALLAAMAGGALFGAAWAAIPAYLQARGAATS